MIDAEGDRSTRVINLVLSNVGLSHAENVEVRFDPPLKAAAPQIDHTETAAVWNQPLMPPRNVIRTILDHGSDRAKSNLPTGYAVKVRYDSPSTRETGIEHDYRIDLNASVYAVRQSDLVDKDTPKQTAALESIAKSLGESR